MDSTKREPLESIRKSDRLPQTRKAIAPHLQLNQKAIASPKKKSNRPSSLSQTKSDRLPSLTIKYQA
ncbi:MAG: hypothetical protein V7K77_13770 [Nostoc sp.]|uniref:hypothetical protein n=1 Tax=Nostoc sp. TaxID=1180 RepID=UPI002FF4C77E